MAIATRTALDKAKDAANKLTEMVSKTDDEALQDLVGELHESLDAIREAGPDTKVEDPVPPGYRKRPPNPVDPSLDTGIERERHPHTGEDLSHKRKGPHTQVHPDVQGTPPEDQEFNEAETEKRKEAGLKKGKVTAKSDQDRRP